MLIPDPRVLAQNRRYEESALQQYHRDGQAHTEDRDRRLTEATGIPHQVNHTVPLQGAIEFGLHVETNLQILTGTENSRKSNSFEVI